MKRILVILCCLSLLVTTVIPASAAEMEEMELNAQVYAFMFPQFSDNFGAAHNVSPSSVPTEERVIWIFVPEDNSNVKLIHFGNNEKLFFETYYPDFAFSDNLKLSEYFYEGQSCYCLNGNFSLSGYDYLDTASVTKMVEVNTEPPSLSDFVSSDSLEGLFDETVALLPAVLVALVCLIGIRKGIAFLADLLRKA